MTSLLTKFLTAILMLCVICGCSRNNAKGKCVQAYDGPWEVIGGPVPSREEIEVELVGMTVADANRFFGARIPYRIDRDQQKIFWYAEKRRSYSEFNRQTQCSEEKLHQAFLFVEAKLDSKGVIEACSLRTKAFLSTSGVTREKAEQSPLGPLDSDMSHCAKNGARGRAP